jgi:ABC-type bacteriocin/lantibiotic exporter with double-glycine peptidase domain
MARRDHLERLSRPADVQQALEDMHMAAQYHGEYLTREELANRLGVATTNDRINTFDLLNACLHAGINPHIQSLPDQERIAIIGSAMKWLERAVN